MVRPDRNGDPTCLYPAYRETLPGGRSYLVLDQVEAATKLTPGIESPTVSPLHRKGWVAVRAMVPRKGSQRLMDELYGLGARGILLTDIHACRL